jgi:hypothetical protein
VEKSVVAEITNKCYNTMMSTRLLVLGSLALLLMQPVSALAQESDGTILSPEDVLLQQALDGQYEINPRMAGRISELQQQRAADARAAAQLAASQQSSSAAIAETEPEVVTQETTPEVTHAAAPEISLADQRLLDRLHQRQLDALDAQLDGLHRGAPLAPTGAGTWLMLSAVTLAGALTLVLARRYKVSLKFW